MPASAGRAFVPDARDRCMLVNIGFVNIGFVNIGLLCVGFVCTGFVKR